MDNCIFCTNPANSKEDLFPRWVLERVKTRELLYRKFGDEEPELTESQEVRIPCVCERCNNGWMSRLEKKCKPVVGLLLEDLELDLDLDHQKFLSEWALKMAMVNDAYEDHDRFFTDSERRAFKNDNRAIPNGTGVWAARFCGRTLSSIGSAFKMGILGNTGLVAGHVYTVTVGHLSLQALSLHEAPGLGITQVNVAASPLKWNDILVQLWPPVTNRKEKRKWPPRYSCALVENLSFGNLHYGRLVSRFNVTDGHSIRSRDPLGDSSTKRQTES
jgi:hypothetical protein